MKKILFVAGGSNAGSDHALFSLINSLDSHEFETIVLSQFDEYYHSHRVKAGFIYHQAGLLSSRNISGRIIDRLFYKDEFYPMRRHLEKILEKHKPDLIYFNTLTLPGWCDYLFSRDIPKILHTHSLDQHYFNFSHSFLERRLKRVNLVVSVSEAQKQTLESITAGLNIETIHPAVFLDEIQIEDFDRRKIREDYGIPEDAFVWAMASVYFNYNKNPVRFVEIARRIIEKTDKPVYFLWIGGNPDATACRTAINLAGSYGISSKIRFAGPHDRPDYLRLLKATDGFILVSLQEAFPLVSLDAIVMGKPVVAFDCGGINEIITEKSGKIIKAYAYHEMADEAVQMMNSYGRYNAEEMRGTISQYDISVTSEKWERMLRHILTI